ncbi:hypothetical protein [Romboutsia sp.]|uniref:hypothetical protein n=1 Tax=Romboutsia sp. TaxID=1965302 RepID=UPI002CF492FD|nr:hypothetical protein [Romboutsia sp.]HSQ89458.1 hypothetical protein [Romboutsia sp.]
MNLNKNKNKKQKLIYDGNQIIKKSILYVRELDFTNLSEDKSKMYGIARNIYKYVGVSDETLGTRTSKWSRKNIKKSNKIGKLLKSIMDMKGFTCNKELNKYLMENTTILRKYYTREQAEYNERTCISINLFEQSNYGTICLNTYDSEVAVVNGKFILNY